ncbi:hypothetical protein JXB01_03460 [Candidatus Micrarchaeota archaeon]|nr:hypothetical protein [Candidatus Micrarchaeota archaeon]
MKKYLCLIAVLVLSLGFAQGPGAGNGSVDGQQAMIQAEGQSSVSPLKIQMQEKLKEQVNQKLQSQIQRIQQIKERIHTAQGQVFEMSKEKYICRVDFYQNMLTAWQEYGNVSDETLNKLEDVKTTLPELEDRTDYQTYLVDEARPALAESALELHNIYTYINTLDQEERDNAKLLYQEARSGYTGCIKESSLELAKTRAQYVYEWQEKAKNLSMSMQKKGYNTAGMMYATELENQEVQEITEELQTEDDPEKIAEMEKELKQIQLTRWARFKYAHTSSVLEKLRFPAQQAGLSDDVQALDAKLEETNQYLSPATTLTEEEFEQVYQNLNGCSEMLRNMFQEMKK